MGDYLASSEGAVKRLIIRFSFMHALIMTCMMVCVNRCVSRISCICYVSCMTFVDVRSLQSAQTVRDVRGEGGVAMSIDQALGFTVNQYLFAHGMTRADLGEVLGVAGSNVSNRLRGKSRWTAADLAVVAEFFGVGVADLYPSRSGEGWVPAPYVPGTSKASATSGAEAGAVPPVGLEPTTFGLKVRSSDQLS